VFDRLLDLLAAAAKPGHDWRRGGDDYAVELGGLALQHQLIARLADEPGRGVPAVEVRVVYTVLNRSVGLQRAEVAEATDGGVGLRPGRVLLLDLVVDVVVFA